MHDETVPHYDVEVVRAACREGRYYLTEKAQGEFNASKLTVEQVRICLATLVPAHFFKCLVSTSPGYEGELLDWYIVPYPKPSRRRPKGLSIKVVVEDGDELVKLISFHWTDI